MMNSINQIDPQVMMKCLPASVPSHKGVKIQARSATVYNASIPTRDEIRRENFKRRQMQMNCQGFKSPIYLPYQGIGEPISFDDKRLLLAAIGFQSKDSSCEKDRSWVENQKEIEKKKEKEKNSKTKILVSSKQVLLRTNKKLNTLHQAVVQGRVLVRNVRLGRCYFQILKEQEKVKKQFAEREERAHNEWAKLQWRNPTFVNNESENGEEQKEEEKEDEDGEERSNLNESSTNPGRKPKLSLNEQNQKKKSSIIRPYTPLYTNMAHCTADLDRDALFRQLCVLLWLLEATNTDSVHAMIPIHSCWKREEICGSRSNYRKNLKPRWETFNNSSMLTGKSFGRSKQHGGLTRRSSSQRSSFTPGISACTTSDQSSLISHPDGSVPEESIDLSDEDISHQLESSRFHKEAWKPKGSERCGLQKSKQARLVSCPNEQIVKEELPKRKLTHLRPKSSPAFIFRGGLAPPFTNESIVKELHEKFEEVKEEKALILHESLERLEKECLLMSEKRYRAMLIDYNNYHQALAEMRHQNSNQNNENNETENKIKNNGRNWFTQLELSIPPELKNIWYYHIILQKLSKFGLIPIGSKFGRFLKVLSGLQPWQICSPDISAAIEFFRAKIIEMTIEEYERWFQQQFPFIYRPETAPAKPQNKNKNPSKKRPVL